MRRSVPLTYAKMKQENKDIAIAALAALLLLSAILNWLQCEQTDRLLERIEEMEHYQSVISSQVDEIEIMEEAGHGDE